MINIDSIPEIPEGMMLVSRREYFDLDSRCEAAESKLADLDKQEPFRLMLCDSRFGSEDLVDYPLIGTPDEYTKVIPLYLHPNKASPAQRITEQDAREILAEADRNPLTQSSYWIPALLAKLNEHREPEVKTVSATVQEFSDDEYICIRDAADRLISAVGKDVDGDQSECSLISEFIDEIIIDVIEPLKIEWYDDDEGCGYMHSVNPRLPVTANKAEVPEGWKLVPVKLDSYMQNSGRAVKITYGFDGEDEPLVTACGRDEIAKIWDAILSAAPLPPLKDGAQ